MNSFCRLLPHRHLIMAHLMQWFQPGNDHCERSSITYDSANPDTIRHQLMLAQSVGIDAFMVDWYGKQDTHGDGAFKQLLAQATSMDMRVGVCIDKGAIDPHSPTSSFQQQLDYIKATYAPSPAFFTDFVTEFGCGAKGVDFTKIKVDRLLHDDPKYGEFFTWVGLPSGASQIAPQYGNPKCIMGSVCAHFDDSSPTDPTKSVWGGPARRMTGNLLVSTNWLACWQQIPSTMRYVQIVTWNDYEERTAIEGELEMFA